MEKVDARLSQRANWRNLTQIRPHAFALFIQYSLLDLTMNFN